MDKVSQLAREGLRVRLVLHKGRTQRLADRQSLEATRVERDDTALTATLEQHERVQAE